MTNVSIGLKKDLDSIMKIDTEVIGNDSRRDYIQHALEENRCIVGKIENEIVGFATYDLYFYGNGFISLVIVKPSIRRKGVARGMISLIEEVCPTKKLFSSTNESNLVMQQLFDKLHYKKSGFIENLDEGDPEIVYFKNLQE